MDRFFDGDLLSLVDDRYEYDETRYIYFGLVGDRVAAVVHTPRGNVQRIISARYAEPDEIDAYYEEYGTLLDASR